MDGLSSVCAGLGTVHKDDNGKHIGYDKSEYCSDNLKDLLRYLRRDDPEKRDVFKQVCKWKIVSKDLVPIIQYYQEDRSLVLNAVKVLVFLTMPIEPTSVDIPEQIEYLWELKSAVTVSDIFPVILSFLENPLENLENESFTEDDWKLVQLILTLFRNLLAIQEISNQQRFDGSAPQLIFFRDRFIELMFQENVMDLILALSQHTGGSRCYLRQDNLLLLEIFYYIFKGQEPELIAKARSKGSEVEGNCDDSLTSLQSIMNEEQEKKKLTRFHNLSCYSKFTGTFTRLTLDGSKALLKGNPSANGDALLKAHKGFRGPSKKAVCDNGEPPSTATKILKLLSEFTSQFLSGGYNVLMQSIREDIEKEQQEFQSTDLVMFFQVAQFVTSFQYHRCRSAWPSICVNEAPDATHDDETLFKGSICGPVAETLNEPMFFMVISKWRFAFEGLKQTNDYKILSAAGSLIKVLIRMLELVLKQSQEDSSEPQTARVLLYKLFYDQTEEGMTRFLLTLIKSFDSVKQSKSDLANLVESVHVIIRLMENLQARGTLRVSKKTKRRTKKTETKNENSSEPCGDDITSAIGVPRASGDMVDSSVPENEVLICPNIDKEAEKTISGCQADESVSASANQGDGKLEVEERNFVDAVGLNLDDDNHNSSSSEEEPVQTAEVDFNVSSLVSAIANTTIVQKLCWLLKFYKSNTFTTNHHILSMLRRISDDLDLAPMLYQLSLLTIFYDILEEQRARPCKEHENIVTFLTTLIRRMLRKMKSNPLLLVEVLFWKTRTECQYINCESMLTDLKRMRSEIGESGRDCINGGNGLFHGEKSVRRSIADALGDDDFFVSHDDDERKEQFEEEHERSGKGGNRLIVNDELECRVNINNERRSRKRVQAFSPDQELQIKELFEQFKDHKRCSFMIANALDGTGKISATRVTYKLKQLGLVKAKKKRIDDVNMHLRDEDSSGIASDDASESDNAVLSSLRKRVKKSKSRRDKDLKKTVSRKLAEDIADDDELLHSLMAKRKKVSAERDNEGLITDSNNRNTKDSNSTDSLYNISVRNASTQPNETAGTSVLNSSREAKGFDASNRPEETMFEDELLAEKGDPITTLTHESSSNRRRRRMVVDLEDDDE